VKVISYANGTTRATASAQYIERDEVELETHTGNRLADKAALERKPI
jgi:type IV secretion system T-DNA border endonuclease VirD2